MIRIKSGRRDSDITHTTTCPSSIISTKCILIPTTLRSTTTTPRHNITTIKCPSPRKGNLLLTLSTPNGLPHIWFCSINTNITTINRISIKSILNIQIIPIIPPINPNHYKRVTFLLASPSPPNNSHRNLIPTRLRINRQLILPSRRQRIGTSLRKTLLRNIRNIKIPHIAPISLLTFNLKPPHMIHIRLPRPNQIRTIFSTPNPNIRTIPNPTTPITIPRNLKTINGKFKDSKSSISQIGSNQFSFSTIDIGQRGSTNITIIHHSITSTSFHLGNFDVVDGVNFTIFTFQTKILNQSHHIRRHPLLIQNLSPLNRLPTTQRPHTRPHSP